jgi:hypothetical protein
LSTAVKKTKDKVFAWVKYNAEGIVELVCDKCILTQERRTIRNRPEGVIPILEPGTVICKRCGEVAE